MTAKRIGPLGGPLSPPEAATTPESINTPRSSREPEWGPVEVKVRADVAALVSGHPMGEALAAMAYRLAQLLDGDVHQMAAGAINRELRENLLELARLGVSDDDDLEANLSRPRMSS